MRILRWFALLSLVVVVPIHGRAQSPSVPVFHGIGDLPGGPTLSSLRDATRVGAMIYAVGASAQNPQTLCSVSPGLGCVGSFAQDTSVLWSFDTNVNAGGLTALPNIVTNTTATNALTAVAISADGNYITSFARITSTGPGATGVRVARTLLPLPSANLDLRPAPFNGQNVAGISAHGDVVLGNKGLRALRYDIANAAGNVTIPLLRATDTANAWASGNTVSGDGMIAAGVSFLSDGVTNPASRGQVFRYRWNPATNTGSISAVPFAAHGGTWNRSMDISANGQFTLLTGDSSAAPLGGVMIHNAADNSLTELGSPMSAWFSTLGAGMTDDGAVVATSFQSGGGAFQRLGYVHNAHGWFQINSVLRHANIDLASQGWDIRGSMNIAGLSGDGTLLFGTMRHNGNLEGFVIEFPAGYLADFNVPAVPVSDTSIVGAWTKPGDPGSGAIIFMKDGTYVQISNHVPANPTGTNGFERGVYSWNSATGNIQIDTFIDTNGDEGIGDSNDRTDLTVTVVGDTLTAVVSPTEIQTMVRLPTDLTSFTGAWVAGDATLPDSTRVFVFPGDGTYFMAEDGDQAVNGFGGRDGMESGTFTIDLPSGLITTTALIDTNGDWGFSNPIGAAQGFLGPDGLTAIGGDASGSGPLARIIDPDAVRPVLLDPLFASGTIGSPFSYGTAATFHPLHYAASGLPAGLSIDAGSGVISGTPAAVGTFAVAVSASNTLASGTGIVTITVHPITCEAGFHLEHDTDLVCTPDPPVITRAGFYAPVQRGLNTVKGGSTVPLKFNVTVNGVAKTDTAGLQMSQTRVDCATSAPLGAATGLAATGGTSLRYSDGQFIMNWSTPTTTGACYLVKMTTTADGGSISATFKIK